MAGRRAAGLSAAALACVPCALVACRSPAAAEVPRADAGAQARTGMLTGQVVTDVAVAAPRVQATPGCWPGDDGLELRPGPVAGALVRVLDATPEAPPATPLVLDERGCRFTTAVAGLVEGQGLLLRGMDRERHAWTVRRAGGVLFRVVQPAGAPAPAHAVPPGAEVVEVTCDEHPTARAHVFSRPNGQFAATDAQGRFELRGMRPGFRTVEAWHPLLLPLRRTVEVLPGGTGVLQLRLPARQSSLTAGMP